MYALLATISPGMWHKYEYAGLILGLRPANERRRYIVTSLIGLAQALDMGGKRKYGMDK